MKKIRTIEYLKNRTINNLDLILIPILVILAIFFILIPPFNQGFLRIIFALPLLLFLPGYMLIAAMFPKRGEISSIERFTFSIGFSIAITVFDGFGLNYTRWGFRPNSITISLSIIIGILFLLTFIQRSRYGEESYSFSIFDIRSFFNTLKNKGPESGPGHDPALEKMLMKTMIIAILIVSAMFIYAKVTTEPEKYTALYILGADGKADNYLTEVSMGEPSIILVGVENYEYAPVNYTLQVSLGGKTLREESIFLDHGSKWLNNITFIPQLTSSIALAGLNKSKLEIQLFKDNKSYRSVYLLVNISLDLIKFAEMPRIVNGDMESNWGWEFSGSSPKIIGSYINSTIFSSRVYEINFSSESEGSKGIISQNLRTNGTARALLSFDIKDSWSNISNYTFKQVLLDDNVIWESNVGIENNSWEYVEVPVMLSGNNSLAFQVYSNSTTNFTGKVWLDNIKLNPFSIASPLGYSIEKGGMMVKLYGLSNRDNLSSIKLSFENHGNMEKKLEFNPLPTLIDDLGNKYDLADVDESRWIRVTPLYPGISRNGTLYFNPINTSAKHLSFILYLNGEKYEFSLRADSGMLDKDSSISIKPNATMGGTITQEGLAVMLKGFQNDQNLRSRVIIAVKNIDMEQKGFIMNPSPVLIDDLGHQYGMIEIERSSQIKQTTIYPEVIRRGSLFFEAINPEAQSLRLILYLNGEKYEFIFPVESILLEEEGFPDNIPGKENAAMGDVITQDGFEVMLKSFENNNLASQVNIEVKNMENEEKQFELDPSPVLIDDFGNQYEILIWDRNNQIKQTLLYPGVVRRGPIFFEPVDPDAKHLRLILNLNGKKIEFGFKAETKRLEEKDLHGNISANIPINATMGQAITQGGFEISLKGFQNTPNWNSQVFISVRNIENKDKPFKFNLTPVIIDDLGNQYEMIDITNSDQIKQTIIAPLSRIEGSILFEPISTDAKYIIFILSISSEKYIFGFEPTYNMTDVSN